MALGIVAKKTGSKWLDFQKGAPRFGSDVIQLFRKDVCPILGYKHSTYSTNRIRGP